MPINFNGCINPARIAEEMEGLKNLIEKKINLSTSVDKEKNYNVPLNRLMRISLLAGLQQNETRTEQDYINQPLNVNSQRCTPSFFTYKNLESLYSPLLKLRYHDLHIEWDNKLLVSRILAAEMLRGRDYLLNDNNLNDFLFATHAHNLAAQRLPRLNLNIGDYGDPDMPALLDINGRAVTNAQIIIAGATGSGKTNLLAVLMQQFRSLTTDTPYPVNFLLFDYKGEFSDPQNNAWLTNFDVGRTNILDPVSKPLPFSPFKNFKGALINQINLYATSMATALASIDRVTASANMSNRLSEAIVEAYKTTQGAPINFQMMLEQYQARMNDANRDDTISSVLKQLVRANIFETQDKASLIDDCYIIKMDQYPKDGPVAKAIVYFLMSKLNDIYESLDKQETSDEAVQIRHFSIIDEAHYMLDFDNRPLRNLIAVGRNKGLSIILATQNMADFKNKGFDFYANAQYPLIMKQQTIDDKVIRDLFGATNAELPEIRSSIAGLQKGELIIKDSNAMVLGLGKKYKKIHVTHLI